MRGRSQRPEVQASQARQELGRRRARRGWQAALGCTALALLVLTQNLAAPEEDQPPTSIPRFSRVDAGVYRTGLVIAAYRMRGQGWSQETAAQELYANGFHRTLDWFFGWTRILALVKS